MKKLWIDDDVARESRDQRSDSVPSPRNRRCACHQGVVLPSSARFRDSRFTVSLPERSGINTSPVHLGMPPDQPDCPISSAPLRQEFSKPCAVWILPSYIGKLGRSSTPRPRALLTYSACLALFYSVLLVGTCSDSQYISEKCLQRSAASSCIRVSPRLPACLDSRALGFQGKCVH